MAEKTYYYEGTLILTNKPIWSCQENIAKEGIKVIKTRPIILESEYMWLDGSSKLKEYLSKREIPMVTLYSGTGNVYYRDEVEFYHRNLFGFVYRAGSQIMEDELIEGLPGPIKRIPLEDADQKLVEYVINGKNIE